MAALRRLTLGWSNSRPQSVTDWGDVLLVVLRGVGFLVVVALGVCRGVFGVALALIHPHPMKQSRLIIARERWNGAVRIVS
jgi:hypothetical protein